MKTKRHILSLLAVSCGALMAQEPGSPAADPFIRKAGAVPVEQTTGDPERNGPRQVSICFEAFSLESGDAAALLRTGLEGKELYEKLVRKVEAKTAIQEALIVVRARSGEKAFMEGISEQIDPTKYEPSNPGAEVPEASAAASSGTATARQQPLASSPQASTEGRVPGGPAPATPTSFGTRDVGWRFEIEPTLGMNNKVIDLHFTPNHTVRAGSLLHGQGLSQVDLPLFETQQIDTSVTVNAGTTFFAGTFNRPGGVPGEPATAKRVWLAFVTPTIVTAECTVLH